jgi:hypothetical protein
MDRLRHCAGVAACEQLKNPKSRNTVKKSITRNQMYQVVGKYYFYGLILYISAGQEKYTPSCN